MRTVGADKYRDFLPGPGLSPVPLGAVPGCGATVQVSHIVVSSNLVICSTLMSCGTAKLDAIKHYVPGDTAVWNPRGLNPKVDSRRMLFQKTKRYLHRVFPMRQAGSVTLVGLLLEKKRSLRILGTSYSICAILCRRSHAGNLHLLHSIPLAHRTACGQKLYSWVLGLLLNLRPACLPGPANNLKLRHYQ